jgi:cell wall-associated NlpC family hydrolase
MSDLGAQLAAQAIEWDRLRVPYVHRGTRRTGCDCTGLLIGCLRELGYLRNYKLRWYPRDWNVHAMGKSDDFLRQELERVANPVKRDPMPGDVVLFRFGHCNAHCGIAISQVAFVHSHASAKRVTRGLFRTPKWFSRTAGIWEMDPDKMRSVNG